MTLIVHGYTKNFCIFLKTSFEIKNDSAFPNGYLHNNCNVAPVRAFRLSPSKLQTRSKVQALLRVCTVVEWNELRCSQLAHSYSTLWGKENEIL